MSKQAENDNAVETVMSRVLAPAGLEERHLSQALGSINLPDVDAADLYFQFSRHESCTCEYGILKDACVCPEQRVAVRTLSGVKRGCACSALL